MVATITGVATHINEIESRDYLTHCHGYTLQLAVGETTEAIKIMRGTLTLRKDTAPRNSDDRDFLCVGFLSQTFTIHRTAGEAGGYLFNSSLPLPPASQTLTHWSSNYCRELTFAHS